MHYPPSSSSTSVQGPVANSNMVAQTQPQVAPSQSESYNFNGERMVDGRKMVNTQTWMNEHRFYNVPQQQPSVRFFLFFILIFQIRLISPCI